MSLVLASIEFVDTNSLIRGFFAPETPKEMSKIRKRNIEIHFFLNEEENNQLNKLVKETNISKSNLLRCLICGFTPVEAPPADYPKLIKELRAVGNNLNQLVRLARTTGYINTPELTKILDDLRKTEHEVNLAFTVKQVKK